MQTLIFLLLAIGLYFFIKRIFTVGGSRQERTLLIGTGIGILGLLIYMVVHGRFQFLAPLMAGLIPIIRRLPLLMISFSRVFPQQRAQMLRHIRSIFSGRSKGADKAWGQSRHTSQQRRWRAGIATEREAALQALGLVGHPDKAAIIKAHRKRMQTAHPDHGGSHEEASRLNTAKDYLLAELRNQQ